jgi:hypothetical protein
MLPRKLAKNVIAADFSAGVRWNQSASFNPENLHIDDVLPANSFAPMSRRLSWLSGDATD